MSAMIPGVETMVIGIHSPQERIILPISWHELRNLQGLFFGILSQCVTLSEEGFTNPQIYQFAMSQITLNAGQVINAVVDGDPVDEKEISISQAFELAEKVYRMNFEVISKNAQSHLLKADVLMKKATKNEA